jgi:hypothetical protein
MHIEAIRLKNFKVFRDVHLQEIPKALGHRRRQRQRQNHVL